MTDPEVVLLDLGGVLLDIDFERAFAAWARGADRPLAQLRAEFFDLPALHAHERGELSCTEFFRTVSAHFGLGLSPAAVRDGWNALLVGEVPGVRDALAGLAGRRRLALLSNTNASHEAAFRARHGALLAPFERLFLSHDLGLRKPEPKIFAVTVRALGVAAERILFLDDTVANVTAARAAGLDAIHVADADTVRTTLARL